MVTAAAVAKRIGVLSLRQLHLGQDKGCEILLRLDDREAVIDTVDVMIIALTTIAAWTSEAMQVDGTR